MNTQTEITNKAQHSDEAESAIRNADWSKAFRKSDCDCNATFVNPNCEQHGAHEYHGKPKAQHSPLPWNVADFDNQVSDKAQTFIFASDGDVIAEVQYNSSYDRAVADAKLIVASVNHADKLAEALKDCVTSPGALAERSHEYALRRLATITATATEALAAYEAAQ